ncbi:MAG: hypothetical protein QM627_04555 [Luteolibacter sp.]
MKKFVLSLLFFFWPWVLSAANAPTVQEVESAWKQRPELDEIVWQDSRRGEPFRVRILSSMDKEIVVEKQLPAGWTRKTLRLDELGAIRFHPLIWETRSHPGQDWIPALQVLWNMRKPLLGRASGVAECGIALAQTMGETSDPASWQKAEEILQAIARREKDVSLQKQALREIRVFSFRRLLRDGDEAEKEKQAWEITETELEETGDLMLLATSFLADLHFQRLIELQEEHPRWMEDPEVTEPRNRLYHLVLDLALYPSLFCGDREKEASEGLGKAIHVYHLCGERDLLRAAIGDLLKFYPESEAAKRVAHLMEDSVADAVPVVKPEKTASPPPAENSETPLRYNLFKD